MAETDRLSEVFPRPQETARLRVFLGKWRLTGTLELDGKAFEFAGRATVSPVAGEWGALVIGKLDVKGLGSYEEADILAFDKNEGVFRYFSVTNTGAAFDHKGTWIGASTLQLSFESAHEGRSYSEDLIFNVLDEDNIWVRESDSVDGRRTLTLVADMTRDKDSAIVAP